MTTEETTENITTTTNGPGADAKLDTIPGALGGFIQGAMPPQGLPAFVEQVQTTATNVFDLYSNVFGQLTGGFRFPIEAFDPVFEGINSVIQSVEKTFFASNDGSCLPRKVRINIQKHSNDATTQPAEQEEAS